MKVYCYNREVGPGGKIELLVTLEFHGVETLGDEDRELLRKQIGGMVEQYTADHFYTVFDDEVAQIERVLKSGEIIGQRKVGVGGPYSSIDPLGYQNVYCIVFDADADHPDGSWMRHDFSVHETCGQAGMWKCKDTARLTLFHYFTGLVEEEMAREDIDFNLPGFMNRPAFFDGDIREPMYDMDGSYYHADPTPEQEAEYRKWQEHCMATGADPSGIDWDAGDLPDFIAP